MSKGVNKAIIVGNLGKNPSIHTLPSGDKVANFSVATMEQWKDKTTGEKQERTEWHNCTAFGRLAEVIENYVGKGDKVYVEGPLQTRKWQDNNGVDRYTTEIKVRDFQMLGGKKGSDKPHQKPGENVPPGDYDDDLPL